MATSSSLLCLPEELIVLVLECLMPEGPKERRDSSARDFISLASTCRKCERAANALVHRHAWKSLKPVTFTWSRRFASRPSIRKKKLFDLPYMRFKHRKCSRLVLRSTEMSIFIDDTLVAAQAKSNLAAVVKLELISCFDTTHWIPKLIELLPNLASVKIESFMHRVYSTLGEVVIRERRLNRLSVTHYCGDIACALSILKFHSVRTLKLNGKNSPENFLKVIRWLQTHDRNELGSHCRELFSKVGVVHIKEVSLTYTKHTIMLLIQCHELCDTRFVIECYDLVQNQVVNAAFIREVAHYGDRIQLFAPKKLNR